MRVREDGFLESEPRYDVALLMLDRKVQLAPNVAPICLPPDPAELPPGTLVLDQPDSPGTAATVVGWGRLGSSPGAPHSSILQAATVPILSNIEVRIELLFKKWRIDHELVIIILFPKFVSI